ncbi:aldo/keto reductase [Rhizobium sp. CF142]|uniref:aldo/keto reductase n=1 Tax=Rhizobium sp. CF142 TaxID=1144314 RepID=UPI00026EECAD|nr:aldo/keto reductase [Rhizobium sp. CF142]EJJ31524.1 putative oxidoreductase, aryl-alcohol dehydrogenase like protein [Rhizobium sp. CF142]
MRVDDVRRLGQTGLDITAMGFGGHPIGGLPMVFPDSALDAIDRAHAVGIRLFDTAPAYGRGLSERRMGQVLGAKSRNSFVLSSKVGRYLVPDASADEKAPGTPMRVVVDYSRDATLRSIEASLHRLGLARLDLVLIHDVDMRAHKTEEVYKARFREAMDGAYRALTELRDQQVIGAIGIGVNEVKPCLDFASAGRFDCFMLAGRFTLLEHAEALEKLLPLCLDQSVGVLMAGPYNSGILGSGPIPGAKYFYEDASPEILARTRRIQAVCEEFAVPLAAAALQFPLLHRAISSVVVGSVTPPQVDQNVEFMKVEIPIDLWRQLQAEKLLAESVPIAGDGGEDGDGRRKPELGR